MPVKILPFTTKDEIPFGLHGESGFSSSLALRQKAAPEQSWKEAIQENDLVSHGAHKADQMSEMQRYQFIEFEA
jgi:hypothetical protein